MHWHHIQFLSLCSQVSKKKELLQRTITLTTMQQEEQQTSQRADIYQKCCHLYEHMFETSFNHLQDFPVSVNNPRNIAII